MSRGSDLKNFKKSTVNFVSRPLVHILIKFQNSSPKYLIFIWLKLGSLYNLYLYYLNGFFWNKKFQQLLLQGNRIKWHKNIQLLTHEINKKIFRHEIVTLNQTNKHFSKGLPLENAGSPWENFQHDVIFVHGRWTKWQGTIENLK